MKRQPNVDRSGGMSGPEVCLNSFLKNAKCLKREGEYAGRRRDGGGGGAGVRIRSRGYGLGTRMSLNPFLNQNGIFTLNVFKHQIDILTPII